MNQGWTYAQGIHPGGGKTRSQDACAVVLCGEVFVAAVADGAGSASHADRGARIVVQTFTELGIDLLTDRGAVQRMIDTIRARITDAAKLIDAEPEDFSSTLVGAVIAPDRAVFLQVGDGAAVFSDDAGLRLAVEPEVCEFVNSTRFVTGPDAAAHARFIQIDTSVSNLALFSDGLQPLLLDAKNEPHLPFFEAAFRTLRGEETHDAQASAWIEQTLASDPVTRRTDDDTSLVIARRFVR